MLHCQEDYEYSETPEEPAEEEGSEPTEEYEPELVEDCEVVGDELQLEGDGCPEPGERAPFGPPEAAVGEPLYIDKPKSEHGAPPAVEDVIAAPPEATEPMSGEEAPASGESSRPVSRVK